MIVQRAGERTVEPMAWGVSRFIGQGKTKPVVNARNDKLLSRTWKDCTDMLLDLAPHVPAQRSLFRPELRFSEKARLQIAVDRLNRQFGRDTVRTARQGFADKHRLRAEKRSRCFTTRWEELLRV